MIFHSLVRVPYEFINPAKLKRSGVGLARLFLLEVVVVYDYMILSLNKVFLEVELAILLS